MIVLHPLDAALSDLRCPASGLSFPPEGWEIIQEWGLGYALRHRNGLRVLVDCGLKDDDKFWLHVSFSRAKSMPTHEDSCFVKQAFIGDRYAYAVFPPKSQYVNIHQFCLHLWALVDDSDGRALPEFSGEYMGVKTI